MEEKKAAGAAPGSDAKIAKNDHMAKNPTGIIKPVRAIGMSQRVLINAALERKDEKWRPGGSAKAPADDLREFPTWGLPRDLQKVIQDVADGYQCDQSIVTASIFAAAGAALGKSIIGISDNYRNYPALWFVIVGKASSGKSAPLDWVFKPLMDYDAEAYKAYKASRIQYEAEAKESRGEPPRLLSRIAAKLQAITPPLASNDEMELMTTKDVRALFSVTDKTLHVWNKTGFLPRIRIGGVVRYRREDVERAAQVKNHKTE